jgi:hypothetical protein
MEHLNLDIKMIMIQMKDIIHNFPLSRSSVTLLSLLSRECAVDVNFLCEFRGSHNLAEKKCVTKGRNESC